MNESTEDRLISLCRRKWIPTEEQDREMMAAFASLVAEPDFALNPAQLNRIRAQFSHFFNEHLFVCAGEFSGTDEERRQKLLILEHLGIGHRGALVGLAHWITGLSTEICSEILGRVTSQPGAAENIREDLAAGLAELADACKVEHAGVDPWIKTPAIALLPKISHCRSAWLLLCHAADPEPEPSPAARVAAIGALAGLVDIDSPALPPARLGELRRAAAVSIGGPFASAGKRLSECNALLAFETASAALQDPTNDVFDAALAFFAGAFSSRAWDPFLRHLQGVNLGPYFETLGSLVRSGGRRAGRVILLLSDPELLYLQLRRADRLAAFHERVTPGNVVQPVIDGLWAGSAHLILRLGEHVYDSEGDFDEAVNALGAIAVLSGREEAKYRKFLIDAFTHFADQGRLNLPCPTISYTELMAFEEAVDPAFYRQFHCRGGESCTLEKEGTQADHRPMKSLTDSSAPYYYVSDDYLTAHCGIKSNSPHACSLFPATRCEKGLTHRFPFRNGAVDFLTKRVVANYSTAGFLSKYPAPFVTAKTKANLAALLSDGNSSYWRQDTPDWGALEIVGKSAVTVEAVFENREKSYKKRFRSAGDSLLTRLEMISHKEPDRRLIKALLDAMKVLSVGDVTTQEFLVQIFGKDPTTFYWHEPTRIWIIETLAAITREELMSSRQTVFHWLSGIEGRQFVGESAEVVMAAKQARKLLRRTNVSNPGTEMLLAHSSEQPRDAVGLPPEP